MAERVWQDEKMEVRKFAVKGNDKKKRIGESEKELRENFWCSVTLWVIHLAHWASRHLPTCTIHNKGKI